MIVNFVVEKGGYTPQKAHEQDAGFDLYAPEVTVVLKGMSAEIDTKVRVEIPEGYVGLILPKSGLFFKYGLFACGVIDSGYTGTMRVKMFNFGDASYVFEAGDKVTQLIIMPIASVSAQLVDQLEDTDRGNGGFGSTGR